MRGVWSRAASEKTSKESKRHRLLTLELRRLVGPLKYADRLGEEAVCGGGGQGEGSKKMKHPEVHHEAFLTGQYTA